MVVDGYEVEAGLGGGEVGGEELDAVGEDDGECVALPEPGRTQPVDQVVGSGVQPAAVQVCPSGATRTIRSGSAVAWAQKPFGGWFMRRSVRRSG